MDGAYKRSFDEDVWELYDTNTDWTQAKDLAQAQPQKLAELQRLFLIEAGKYSVLPLDDRTFERFDPDLAGRPQLIQGKTQILFGGWVACREFDPSDEEQVLLGHGRCGSAEDGR
jgi:arylsulfatase